MPPEPPRIILTSGEPAGIGPDLIVGLAQLERPADVTVIADPDLLQARARQLSLPLELVEGDRPGPEPAMLKPPMLRLLPLRLNAPARAGRPDTANAPYVLKMLELAARRCLRGDYAAMVTAPAQKSVINEAGIAFSGHTEYLAEKCGAGLPVMLLSCPGLRVALVSTHLPLRAVPAAITPERLRSVLDTLLRELPLRLGIDRPAISVCGLNPHAGEDGHLGREERDIIAPVLQRLRAEGHAVRGPLPADTAFLPESRQETDVYVCMYHDQGLPVLKALGFGAGVNSTLGLPIIRTSVDHGTALTLAGTGKAECGSLIAALEAAASMARQQRRFFREALDKSIPDCSRPPVPDAALPPTSL